MATCKEAMEHIRKCQKCQEALEKEKKDLIVDENGLLPFSC